MTTFLAFVIVITVLVFFHELGHYLAARSVGVRVERFSILLPPRLFSFTSVDGGWEFKLFFFGKDESGKLIWKPVISKLIPRPGRHGSLTEYTLALIPFGGYVKMSGMIDESMDTSIEHAPFELLSKSKWAQAWVMSAGVIMNILLAFVLFSWIAGVTGIPEISNEPVVSTVLKNMPAEEIGLLPGDRIVSIGGQPVTTWEEMTNLIRPIPAQEVLLVWQRDDAQMKAEVRIGINPNPVQNDSTGMLGIAPVWEYQPVNFVGA
ncbi:MAG: site-2 protease family protein, partial [Candidatus Marinimicrobia bacterium]|nr:site-2 protease family protein [Candidatus Neomarinimicrobiota bacterium]